MKRVAHTYCLFALVVTSINVFFFRKMDKHSFYHHYFKVIEEVELRNSQEIAPAPGLWQVAKQALSQFWSSVFQWLLAGFALWATPRLWLGEWRWQRPLLPFSLSAQEVSLALHPVRGP